MIEIKKKGTNKYSFKLKSQSGHTLLRSVEYFDKAEMQHTVQNLNPTNIKSIRFERKTSNDGLFLFDIKNPNGQLIGHSQYYTSEAGMENGIKTLMKRIDTLSHLGEL
ncbi:YegP family protein [Maribacter polysiphoniae]|uniref:YegP family protein n=1 Tax=Maribacter polysiphoniae TaxID=429344 RepID=A0A316DYE0_9FLAO|nr:YegP family protein [Maribacter polysiphoniae]MBD1261744.1 YegP family protein [Maribacter polysiphoniae]PWK22448.1 hypothetical protein LX92_02922 [Maribacter polysiphoniae]